MKTEALTMKIFRQILGYEKDEKGVDDLTKPIKAPMPVYSTDGAACFDIYSGNLEGIVIEPGKYALVPTGMKLEVQKGCQLLLFNRSGISTKGDVILCTGTSVIDDDYRGELLIPLYNHGRNCFVVEPFMRLCQGQVLPKWVTTLQEVSTDEELSITNRAEGGFNSTGTK